MDNKLRNKLNNVLKGLILSKEQKQQLVEVFDEVSNGGGSNVLNAEYIYTSKGEYFVINGITYNSLNYSGDNPEIFNTDLYNYILNNNFTKIKLKQIEDGITYFFESAGFWYSEGSSIVFGGITKYSYRGPTTFRLSILRDDD